MCDFEDTCPLDALNDYDNDGLCANEDNDDDNDGVIDEDDFAPNDEQRQYCTKIDSGDDSCTEDYCIYAIDTKDCDDDAAGNPYSIEGGNLGGVTGADLICNLHQISMPNENSEDYVYKAFIGDKNVRDTDNDWVLQSNKTYYRPDGTEIGTTTNQGIFDFDNGNELVNTLKPSGSGEHWSGFGASSPWSIIENSDNCSDWTSSLSSDSGKVGFNGSTSYENISSYSKFCNTWKDIVCVASPEPDSDNDRIIDINDNCPEIYSPDNSCDAVYDGEIYTLIDANNPYFTQQVEANKTEYFSDLVFSSSNELFGTGFAFGTIPTDSTSNINGQFSSNNTNSGDAFIAKIDPYNLLTEWVVYQPNSDDNGPDYGYDIALDESFSNLLIYSVGRSDGHHGSYGNNIDTTASNGTFGFLTQHELNSGSDLTGIGESDDDTLSRNWLVQPGTFNSNWSDKSLTEVATNNNGIVYAAGANEDDGIIIIYNATGIELNTYSFASSNNEYDSVNDIYYENVNGSEFIYVTISSYGNILGFTNIGEKDSYIAKFELQNEGEGFDVNNPVCVTRINNSNAYADSLRTIKGDGLGNIYVGGDLYTNANSNSQDVFVSKYDANCTHQWTTDITSTNGKQEFLTDLELNLSHITDETDVRIYFSGSTYGSLPNNSFGGGGNKTDYFLGMLDYEGSLLSLYQNGGNGFDTAKGIAVNPINGAIYVSILTDKSVVPGKNGAYYDYVIQKFYDLSLDYDGDGIIAKYDDDNDGDGLSDELEIQLNLNPFESDSDGNLVSDGEEDSNGNGISNANEYN
ncbi:DUF1554 domain-containing protein [Paraphotobacterium marinum]|uniref:DUF1554 domain-containing protein n=1 Tax=Paraphotobacterium marinum TaxID=1755811 RepID=UPI0039EC0568